MPTLAIVPPLSAQTVATGKVRLTQKFAEGMAQYSDLWPGPVLAVMHPDAEETSGNLDDRIFAISELPFGVRIASFENDEVLQALDDADVVMLAGDHRLASLAHWCRSTGKKSVFVSEYSLKTRLQIIRAEVHNPVIRWRRYLWQFGQELRNRRSVLAADAVQCNGTPTYDIYRHLNNNTLLYFDNRVTADMVADKAAVAGRIANIKRGGPVRLAFSGRLNAMKGADDLLKVARELVSAGIPFRMDIFGDGPLKESLARGIEENGLGGLVNLGGVLDFASELMPYIREHADLFICCHRQGDPSCSYLETFSCGVPIVGYANEALQGLIARRPMGWTTPLNNPARLAAKIAELYADPLRLADAANAALEFAREHTFDNEFSARINQIKALIE